MLETLSVRPRICAQIRSGPLGRWVDDFVDVLVTRGYATSTVRRYVRAAAIFSAWLDQERVAAPDVDETLVTRFLTGLSRRPSPTRPNGVLSDVAYGVRLLAAHLWTRGVAARHVPVAAPCESEQWLQRFDDHLFSVNYFCRFATAILAGSTRRPGQRGPRCPPRVVVGRDAPSRLGRKAHNCNLSGGAGGVSPEGP